MQKITREQLIDKAVSLLENGTVEAVLGWGKGEFDYDVTPAVFKTADELKAGFVWNDFCGANFSKYLVAKTGKIEGKILYIRKAGEARSSLCQFVLQVGYEPVAPPNRFIQSLNQNLGIQGSRGGRTFTLQGGSCNRVQSGHW